MINKNNNIIYKISIDVGDKIELYNNNVLVGSRVWEGRMIDIPAMGEDGSVLTENYSTTNTVPNFKLVKTNGEIFDLTAESIPSWEHNGLFIINNLSITYATASIAVDDITGREIAKLVDRELKAGYHSIIWDAGDMSSGIYFVKFYSNDFTMTQKLILIK